MAVDIQPSQVDEMDRMGLLSKNGFERISGARERQHIQLAGAQHAIASGASGVVSGDAVGAPKITTGSTSGTVTASAPAPSAVTNNRISVASSGPMDSASQADNGGDGGEGSAGSSGASSGGSPSQASAGGRQRNAGNAITVANTPTFMFNDPAFYAANVQAMA